MDGSGNAGQSMQARISTEAVRLVREYTGRGPTKARTIVDDRLVTILMADTLTSGERTLVENGFEEGVLRTRRQFQAAMREDLIAIVEAQVERKVVAMMSDNHIDPDYGVEVLVLAPPDRV